MAARLYSDMLGELMRSPGLLAAIREPNSKVKEREGWGTGREGRNGEVEGKERWREGRWKERR